MPCYIQIKSVNATQHPGGLMSVLGTYVLQMDCASPYVELDGLGPVTSTASGTPGEYLFEIAQAKDKCGEEIRLRARCASTQEWCYSESVILECKESCPLSLISISGTVSGNQLNVTGSASWTGTCKPFQIFVQVWHQGAWQTIPSPINTNSTGQFSFSFSLPHNDDQNFCGAEVRLIVECKEKPLCVSGVRSIECTGSCPCLPITVTHQLGACVNGWRPATVQVSFGNTPAGCTALTHVTAVLNGTTYFFSPSSLSNIIQLLAPTSGVTTFTLLFTGSNDSTCSLPYSIDVGPCQSVQPCCPTNPILQLSQSSCVKVGDKCCRNLIANYTADVCDGTEITIEIRKDNVDPPIATFNSDLDENDPMMIAKLLVCEPGRYTVRAFPTLPTGCPSSATVESQIDIDACATGDCLPVPEICCPTTSITSCIVGCNENTETAEVRVKAVVIAPANCSEPIEAELVVDNIVVDKGSGSSFTMKGNLNRPCGNYQATVRLLGNEGECGTSSTSICVPVCETSNCEYWRLLASLVLAITYALGFHAVWQSGSLWTSALVCFLVTVVLIVIWLSQCKKNCLWNRILHFLWVGLTGGAYLFIFTGAISIPILTGWNSPLGILIFIIFCLIPFVPYIFWRGQCPLKCQRKRSYFEAFTIGAVTAIAIVTPWLLSSANKLPGWVFVAVGLLWYGWRIKVKNCKEDCS